MKTASFVTIGCKLNQFETEQMREALESRGYRTVSSAESADLYVINTCTVTGKSDYRSRQAVRRAIRSNPGAFVVATGCYAQRSPEDLARIEGIDVILGNAEKHNLVRYLTEKQARPVIKVTDPNLAGEVLSDRHLCGFGRYTRAFVKIQDGCDNRCSYCAVPLARGASRSKPADTVVDEIKELVDAGYREIILTGVHLGSYGRDVSPYTCLADLIERIVAVDGLNRLRLSSIEPTDFDDRLIELIGDPLMKVCPHVHIPLQSGDNRVLRTMGRLYTRAQYADLITRIASRVPRCGVGADVMVGFPGEDRSAFANTYALIRDLPITYLHVFSFSRRPGTGAWGMRDKVEPGEKKRRSRVLRALGRMKSAEFRQSLLGSEVEIIVLGTQAGGFHTGLTGNYVKALFVESFPANTILISKVAGIVDGAILATPVQHSIASR